MGGRSNNLKDKTFGRLSVLCDTGKRIKGNIVWECECECGKIINVRGGSLTTGNTLSCGCFKAERVRETTLKDITGRKFGRLTVYKNTGIIKNGGSYWSCACYCGKTINVRSRDLLSGKTKSCGCLSKEISSENGIKSRKNLIGKQFGLLKVVSFHNSNSFGNALWKCECDCGRETIAVSSNLIRGVTTSCGCIGESYIANRLKKYFSENYSAETEYQEIKNPKTGRYLKYDIFIPNNRVFIEVNGSHHYEYLGSGFIKSEEEFASLKNRDRVKKEHAEKTGIYIEIDIRKIKTFEDALDYIFSIIS